MQGSAGPQTSRAKSRRLCSSVVDGGARARACRQRCSRWRPWADAFAAVRSTVACRAFPTPNASSIGTQCARWSVPRTPAG
eukprot:2975285-Rhodomonas_salina.2